MTHEYCIRLFTDPLGDMVIMRLDSEVIAWKFLESGPRWVLPSSNPMLSERTVISHRNQLAVIDDLEVGTVGVDLRNGVPRWIIPVSQEPYCQALSVDEGRAALIVNGRDQ